MIINIILDIWLTLCDMAPYLLFGFLAAGILSSAISTKTVEKHLGTKGFWSVFKAALFGVPLPLCSCSVIPVTVSLKKSGASNGAAAAFLTSTPQTGVDSIFVTFSLLGPVFAIFRPVVALITGIITGLLVNLTGIITGLLVNLTDKEKVSPHNEPEKVKCEHSCCSAKSTKVPNKFLQVLRYGFITIPGDVSKPLLLGILIAGIISALVPTDFFASKLGDGFLPMLIMMAIGIPMYVCSTASVPIAAALILKGISPGAAFVFLITGAATNAAGIMTIWKVLGKRVAIIYLATVVASALISGYLLNFIFKFVTQHDGYAAKAAGMMPDSVKITSAILLIIILGYSIFSSSMFQGINVEKRT